jgi:uncharacterized membrane protein
VDIAWVRDLIIVIEGCIAIILLLFLGFLAWTVYKLIRDLTGSAKKLSEAALEVMDSVKSTTDNVSMLASFARTEISEPLVHVAVTVQAVSKALDTVMGFFNRKRR